MQTEGATRVKCPTCGAQMRLLKVAPDKTMIAPGYEERTFECSGCHDHVRRLVFIPPAIEPLTSEPTRLPQFGSKARSRAGRLKVLGRARSEPPHESTPCGWLERSL